MGAFSFGDPASVFTEAYISSIVNAVFNAGPVITYDGMYLHVAVFGGLGAADVVADFVRRIFLAAQINALTAYGNHLPCTA